MRRLGGVLGFVWLVACGDSDGTGADTRGDVGDVGDVGDATGGDATVTTGDASDATVISDTTGGTGATDATQTTDGVDADDATDATASDATDATDASDSDSTPAPFERACDDDLDDDGDGATDCADLDCCAASACADTPSCIAPPADPSALAPATDPTVPTVFADSISFLYIGDAPSQRGVAPGAITPDRAGVLRGTVADRAGPRAGVRVSVLDHPELGVTATRADGAYDIAVEAGGRLTLRFDLAGHVPVVRTVLARARDFTAVPDVVLTPYDTAVTTVDLGGTAGVQVARGSPVSDDDGDRRATLVLPEGATATMTLPDGAVVPLATAGLRATELTVGADGPRAMPAPLPPSSAYTYAVELSADEAVAAGATRVDFDPPLALYVDNFLGFPAGGAVPAGFVDPATGGWVASDNGRVIAVTSVDGGAAALDVDGDGAADGDAELAALGITPAERARLATLYAAGATIWRVRIPHITPWDCNWPYGPPDDAVAPPPDGEGSPDPGGDGRDPENECRDGSLIETQSQTLGEDVALVGTPYRLVYSSDRMPGRLTSQPIDIPVTGATLPASLEGAEVIVEVAGVAHRRTFTADPSQRWRFAWDGRDAYGRLVQGSTPAHVRISYLYTAQYYTTPAEFDRAFGRVAGEGAPAESAPPVQLVAVRGDLSMRLERTWDVTLSHLTAPAFALGGWSLDAHHVYDAGGQTLYRGDGTRAAAATLDRVARTVIGGDANGYAGDGGPAHLGLANGVRGLAFGPDGALYFADARNNRVRRIDRAGVVTTVAGGRMLDPLGDGGPALDAYIEGPSDVAVAADGTIYVSQFHRIRRVTPDGIITTIAGPGPLGQPSGSGDGGPAIDAVFEAIQDIELAPDGSIFVGDTIGRIRRIGPDGVIMNFAGGGPAEQSGNGGPAWRARLGVPRSIALAPDGSLYISDGLSAIRKVGVDGIIEHVAGLECNTAPHLGCQNNFGASPDGAVAKTARLNGPSGITVGADGIVWLTEFQRVRRIGADGRLETIAGRLDGADPFIDGTPALQAVITRPNDILVGPDGVVYIGAENFNNNASRIIAIGPASPNVAGADRLVPSTDGAELYLFDRDGRHLKTLDGLTGATLRTFDYDDAGRVIRVRDAYDAATTIEREADGTPAAIVGPDGHRTAMTVGSDGWLASVEDPIGRRHIFTYAAGGLLATLRDGRGGLHEYAWDDLGRLTSDSDPAGGGLTLEHADQEGGFSVTERTASGREVVRTVVEGASPVARAQTATLPGGLGTDRARARDGSVARTAATGRTSSVEVGPDPRFGLLVPRVVAFETASAVAGRGPELVALHEVETPDATDPFAYTRLTDTTTIDGRAWKTMFERATRTRTTTSPAGRVSIEVLDALGQVVEARPAGVLPIVRTRDARGRLATVTQGVRTTTFTYGADGGLASITDPLDRVTTFERDDALRPMRVTLPGGRVLALAWDGGDALTAVGGHAFTHDASGRLATWTPPVIGGSPAPITYARDVDHLVGSITRPGLPALVFDWDGAGRLAGVAAAGDVSVTYGYDPAGGWLASATSSDGVTVAYVVDDPHVTSATWSGAVAGSVQWTYDDAGRVASEQIGARAAVAYGYDADGLVTSVGPLAITRDPASGRVSATAVGVVSDATTYDAYGAVARYEVTAAGDVVYVLELVRDDLGRVTTKTETVDGGAPIATAYAYDDAGHLTGGGFTFDPNGNRLPGTYDAQDRLLAADGATYAHDPAGRRTGRTVASTTTTYRWDARGRMTGATLPGGKEVSYLVDGQGRRVARAVDGVRTAAWIYRDAYRPAAELDAAGAVRWHFVHALREHVPDLLIDAGGDVYRVVTDHIGSVRLIVDTSDGAIVQRLDHDAWGRVVADTSAGFQPLGFAGGLHDPDTGFVQLGERAYDPFTGRFTSPDPLGLSGGDPNLYAYAGGDPVNAVDPDGRIFMNLFLDAAQLAVMLASGEIDRLVDRSQSQAADASNQFFGGRVGVTDALQHCIASCNLTRTAGEGVAELAGYGNEIAGTLGGGGLLEGASDIYNNSIGQACVAAGADTEQGCIDGCVGAQRADLLENDWN